jgi:hypothetical protein
MSHDVQIVTTTDARSSGSRGAGALAVPVARVPVHVRPATMDDLPFIDSLQKKHTHMVGWMPTQQLEGKIKLGHVIVAEELPNANCQLPNENPRSHLEIGNRKSAIPVGYVIGHDQYFKRDDVGIIYQLNVVPERRRSLIGATLIKAMFDRAAYGCKLFCCWCAQDIEANHFWESLGFVPLAFRAGSRTKGAKGTDGRRPQARVHIFWQRRIRAGDSGEKATPYWFPSQTTSGAIREDRIVLPIPPGTHWRDAKPIVLPGEGNGAGDEEPKQLPLKRRAHGRDAHATRAATKEPLPKASITQGGLHFAAPKPAVAESEPKAKGDKRPKVKAPKVKNDPKLVAAARELRDRWLERVHADPSVLTSGGKYDVTRALPNAAIQTENLPALPAPLAA